MRDANKEQQYNIMCNTDVKKLVIKLAIPTTITMLVSSFYSIVDTYYVSQLGTSQSAGVGIIYPVLTIMQAVGFTIGMGSGNKISRAIGQKEDKQADVIGSTGFFLSIFLAILISVIGFLFIDNILSILGCTQTAKEYAEVYLKYILVASPFIIGSFVINNLLRYVGKAFFAMVGITFGAVLNVFLDWYLIDIVKMGVEGVGLATLISQIIAFIILIMCYVLKLGVISLKPSLISMKINDYADIFVTGFPSLCRQGCSSVAGILLNQQGALYGGDVVLAGLNISSKIFNLVFSTALGIGQGFQPVISVNYSAKKYKRSKDAVVFTAFLCVVALFIMGITNFVFANQIVKAFIGDEDVIEIGVLALKMQALSMPLLSVNIMANMSFQATGKKIRATILSCLRQGIIYVPCLLILTKFFQIQGTIIAQPISDFITSVISLPFILTFVKDLSNLKEVEEE